MAIPDWLEGEIRGGAVSWKRLGDYRDQRLAQVTFAARGEREAFVQELAAAGLSEAPPRGITFALESADLMTVAVKLAEHGTAIAVTVAALLKVMQDGPAKLGAMLHRLRGMPGARELHPALHLDAVNRWLDGRHGAGQWRYDPESIEYKDLAGIRVLAVREEASGTVHLLRVQGEGVEPLPSEWMEPDGARP